MVVVDCVSVGLFYCVSGCVCGCCCVLIVIVVIECVRAVFVSLV